MSEQKLLSPIMQAIIDKFKNQYGENYFIGDYDSADENIDLPAILVSLDSFEGVDSTIPELFRTNCIFVAYVCESYKGKAKTRVRDTAFNVAHFVNGNFWGDINTFSKGKFSTAEEEPFNEKIESAEIWRVEWQQEVYISSTK